MEGAWGRLPVVRRPRPNESFLGLLLRNDEANEWPANATGKLVLRNDGGVGFARPGLYVMANVFDRRRVAELLGSPLADIEATTFREPVTRIFGVTESPYRIGRIPPFRICPACVAADRFIGKDTFLPLLAGCVEHRIHFISRCSCGRGLAEYEPSRFPFVCPFCSLDWRSLPQQPLTGPELFRVRQIAHAYRAVFDRGDRHLLASARRAIGPTIRKRWTDGWLEPDDLPVVEAARMITSISAVVAALVACQIDPAYLFDAGPPSDLRCLNAACPTYFSGVAIRLKGRRNGLRERYCIECGSRFLGDRTIGSFDFNNGSPHLGREAVARARAQLAEYHARLSRACDEALDRGERPHLVELFRAAGLPYTRYLRARRLGLVALVRHRLDGKPWRDPRWPTPDSRSRWTYPTPVAGHMRRAPSGRPL